MVRAESAESRRQLLQATFRESWDTETLASLSGWLDLTEAKEHMPEVEVVAFFSQMPRDLRKKLGYKPADAHWWFSLADALENKKAWSLTEAAYRKAVELDPNFALAWGLLANLLAFELSKTAEAEGLSRKAIKLDPKDPFHRTTLGVVLENLGRYAEAEAALRGAIVVDPNCCPAWTWLGVLLTDHTTRNLEAEQALRRAIQIDPAEDLSHSCLAELLARDPTRISEARSHMVKALQLAPHASYLQTQFNRLCGTTSADWQIVLPGLAAWCVANPKSAKVFDFTMDGFLQYARLTKPADALALLQTLPDPSPFETLMDAFRAQADREHLHRLAPERQAVVIELLNRLSTPNGQ